MHMYIYIYRGLTRVFLTLARAQTILYTSCTFSFMRVRAFVIKPIIE